ncbi:uncharacterized protein LOC126784790 [Argentina anserina]|uniref:uncharacterized protein LOC126784790 n=1 Tax=Argentina anserina TaxID=57926 RepID=UPI002176504E|nr:uncharacterized protein LOC126784790 [Potentilla anserina]
MKFSMFFFMCLLSLHFQHSHSTTILVDGVSEWKDPVVHVGDSIIFQHKYHYNLYIFQNQRAFNVCNFTQATLLNKPDSTSYTWHPSRPGFFYFSFNNGSLLNACQDTQKFAIRVSLTAMAPAAAPEPSSKTGSGGRGGSGGGVVSSSPTYPWPFQPHQASLSPSPEPSVGSLLPNKGGSTPFINSNPAVPLPTGEVDSATIRPIPTSGHQGEVMVRLFATQMALFIVVLMML